MTRSPTHLLGLYEVEGWSVNCQKVYNFLNNIKASAQYPAYNPAVCWAGYIDVISRFSAMRLLRRRHKRNPLQNPQNHDKPSLEFSIKIIGKHSRRNSCSGAPNMQTTAMLKTRKLWLRFAGLLIYSSTTKNHQPNSQEILKSKGETVQLYPIRESAAHFGLWRAVGSVGCCFCFES